MNKEHTLLCVDDEPHILNAIKRLLRNEDYSLLTATGGQEALSLMERHIVQVVISDHRMPEMNGVEFLHMVKEIHPDTIRVILSGYADASTIITAVNKGEVYRFIMKPWNGEELQVILRQCFEQFDIIEQNRSLINKIREKNEELDRLNRTLESQIEERTRSLKLAQDIVEHLPIPIIGISAERMIVLVNTAVKNVLLGTAYPGTNIEDVFPQHIVQKIDQSLSGGSQDIHELWHFNKQKAQISFIPLTDRESIRGCIMIMELYK